MDYSFVYRTLPSYSAQLGMVGSTLAFLSYYGTLRGSDHLLRGLGANQIYFHPLQNDYVSRALMIRSSQGYTVAIEGTTTGTQWLGYVVNAGMGSIDGIAGQVFAPFRDIGLNVALQVQSQVDRHYPIFLCGHSLGGAAAAVAARILSARGYTVSGVATFGAPRFCDATFAAGYSVPTYRVFHRDDPVPFMPPDWSASISSVLPAAAAFPPLHNVGWPVPLYDPTQRVGLFSSLNWFLHWAGAAAIPSVRSHFIGNYVRLVWRSIPRTIRRDFGVLYSALYRQGLRLA